MGKKAIQDFSTGNLWKKMFVFSIPLIITNLMQSIYNIVDMIIVGQFSGSAGLTAAGNGGQITMVILYIIMGLANGGAVIVAQMVGAKREKEIPEAFGTMLVFFFLLAIALTVAVIALTHPILHAMKTPAEAYGQTVRYLRICMIGTVFIYLYNMLAAILRGMGNSKTPMILVALTSAVNIVLDLIFVGALGMGAAGAAIATLISQVLCAILIIVFAGRQYDFLKIRRTSLIFKKKILKSLIKIGAPQSIQFVLTALSFVFVLGLINTYGSDASAVSVSVTRLGSFAVLSAQAMMAAIAAMSGQNLGASNPSRALKGMGIGIIYALPLAMFFFLFSELVPGRMLQLFTSEAGILALGAPYLRIVAISFLIETTMFCMYGLMTGSGYTNITMFCAIVSGFVVRYTMAWILSTKTLLAFYGIGWAYVLAPIASNIICIIFLLTGKWKVSRVKI